MKFFRSLLVVGVIGVSSISAQNFEAGVGVADITPKELPLALLGGFTPQPSNQIHDRLSARVLALRNGDGRAVIVIVDNVGINRETLDKFKATAAAATGWEPEEMLIAATHSHSAPSLSGGAGALGAYQKLAEEQITIAISTAINSLQKAKVGFSKSEVPDEVFNRRWFLKEGTMPPNPFGEIDQVKMNPPHNLITTPAGPTDPEVEVIDIRTAKGKPLSILANYSLHYVGGVPNNQISADYFGEFGRIMPARMGGADPSFLAILSNGASGDINNIDFHGKRPPRAPFEQIQMVASKVADAAWLATRTTSHESTAKVSMIQREVTLKRRKPGTEELEQAKKILAMPESERKTLPPLADHYAARTLQSAERPDKMNVILQAIRIGDHAIVSIPFEVLVEIGMELKSRSPFQQTIIMELANGSYGYLPSPKQHSLGGYETWLGTNNVEPGASVILTTQLLEMLQQLHSEH